MEKIMQAIFMAIMQALLTMLPSEGGLRDLFSSLLAMFA